MKKDDERKITYRVGWRKGSIRIGEHGEVRHERERNSVFFRVWGKIAEQVRQGAGMIRAKASSRKSRTTSHSNSRFPDRLGSMLWKPLTPWPVKATSVILWSLPVIAFLCTWGLVYLLTHTY